MAYANLDGIRIPSDEEAAEIERIRQVVLLALTPGMVVPGPGLGFSGHACLLVWAHILRFAGVTRAQARNIANQTIDSEVRPYRKSRRTDLRSALGFPPRRTDPKFAHGAPLP